MSDLTYYCHTCEKWYHPRGIGRHRAMHRDRLETCIIQQPNGEILKYEIIVRRMADE